MISQKHLTFLNISCYVFVDLEALAELQKKLLAQAKNFELKGTILIAPEGINMFLAGLPKKVRSFFSMLKEDARFANLTPKESWSDNQPFRKMKVRIKKEIIRMNQPTIRPKNARATPITAHTLKTWLDNGMDDEGRSIVMLDTRNAFEVDYGTFKNVINWRISKFSEFPDAVIKHKKEIIDKTVVSFCTGGIRCEKAAIFMQQIGIPKVLQLEGGILKYFEEVGDAHFQGDCFVFDERVALSPNLLLLPHLPKSLPK